MIGHEPSMQSAKVGEMEMDFLIICLFFFSLIGLSWEQGGFSVLFWVSVTTDMFLPD